MTRFSIDGARFSDLSVIGWVALGFGTIVTTATLRHGLTALVNGGTLEDLVTLGIGFGVAVILANFAFSEASPEIEGACAKCGDNVRTQANRDGVDEVVKVKGTGSPRRLSVGPLSVVLQTSTEEWLYCSGECADDDRDRRALIGQPDGRQLVSSPDQSVTRATSQRAATDGGQAQRGDQGTPQPETGNSDS